MNFNINNYCIRILLDMEKKYSIMELINKKMKKCKILIINNKFIFFI